MKIEDKKIIAIVLVAGAIFTISYFFDFNFSIDVKTRSEVKTEQLINSGYLQKEVFTKDGFEIPIVWGDLGKKMVGVGVIDSEKFEKLYSNRGNLDDTQKEILYGENNNSVIMTAGNASFLLNMFWALGLANKNAILEEGPMSDPRYGGAGNFASTGGWTLSKNDSMNYYSKLNLVSLTSEQQELVENVSKNIFRPCCGNSTYFPDCNHGMAMFGLLELMASQGASEQEMYSVALKVNSYWFPDTYLTLAKYFGMRGTEWKDVDAKTILGSAYSSGRSYQQILSEVNPEPSGGGGGGCSV